jgi:hypothetical protein
MLGIGGGGGSGDAVALAYSNASYSSSSSSSSSLSASASSSSLTGDASIDDFDLLSLLGEGAFGKVLMVRHKRTARIFAMKIVRKAEVVRADKPRQVRCMLIYLFSLSLFLSLITCLCLTLSVA